MKGYKLELTGVPRQSRLPSPHPLNASQLALVEDEIASLLDKRAIQQVPYHSNLFCSNLFLVEKKGGGQRPVINLSTLNSFVCHHHFKMEDLKVVADSLRPLDFMCKIDLRDAYFAIPIHPAHQKLLCFQFKNVTYQFKCLPFGLTSAPRVFTKVLKPLIVYVRRLGLRICIYLDDMLILNSQREGAMRDASLMLHLLENLGFVVNMDKSILFPSQEMEFLGVLVSSIHMSFSLPESKVLNLRNDCRRLLSSRTASQSDLARLIGKMIAAKAAVFQAPLHYRALQHQKNSLDHQGVPLHQKVILDIEAILDLEWWVTNLATANSRPVKPLLPDLLIQSDASGSGWGAVCNRIETRGTWSLRESSLHINCLELLAATLAIKAFTKCLNNVHVLIQMDNTSAIAYVNKMGGAKQGVLDKHARSLWEWCLSRKITLRAEHIPGRLNVIADAESRAKPDAADWKLDSEVFKVLNHSFGPFTVDLFANRNNTQLERFYSYLPDPLAEQYDALVQPWREENAYAFPPFNLISKCLRKISLEGATLLIICPVWPAQAWYPHLLQLLTDNPVLLPTHSDLLLDPLGNRHPMIVNNSLPLAGWRLSGNTSLQRAYRKKLQIFSSLPNVDQQMLSTSPVGLSGVAGVANDRLIPFVQL